MEEYSHFLLGNNFVSNNDAFQPKTPIIEGSPLPERDRDTHYEVIKNTYEEAVTFGIYALNQFQNENNISADGIYLDVNLANGGNSLKSLDSRYSARLMNVTTIPNENHERSSKATIYLPTDKVDWLDKKLDKYKDSTKDTTHGPSGYALINDINSIECASIESFFRNRHEFDGIQSEEKNWYEVWIANFADDIVPKTRETLLNIGIEVAEKDISFPQMIIFLIHATLEELKKLPHALNFLSEIRLSKQPSILLSGDSFARQEWADLLEDNISIATDENSPIIGLIDTGVNNAHPLLRASLPDDRTDCVISGHQHIDEDGHGTEMGGICLFGDLTDVIYQRDAISISHKLASIKIFSEQLRHLSQKELYGALTEDAVERLEGMGASIFCLAITEDDDCWGIPSSWSADIDKILYHNGECDRLMLVSAGNVQDFENLGQDTYLDYCLSQKSQSPAQALNAITVGAYTEKVVDHRNAANGFPLAPPEELSPYSRTSYFWTSNRIKPDIVMEGGNILMHRLLGELRSTDLSLVTTSRDLNHKFSSFYATSASTALASRLSAKISTKYPQLSTLAIRALLIHSAEWTSKMIEKAKDIRLCMYGYGVPTEERALNSRKTYATYIFENQIIPYTQGSGTSLKYAGFQLVDLPWPTELLQSIGEERVRLKVTLSYYIDPAPGEKGKLNRYRYPSASLYFDLKAPTESTEGFIARHNKLEESPNTATSASARWEIGVRKRQSGSVQSDWLECTGAELAACGQIMIYPGPGWWKEQKLGNIENLIKYALVVSIKTTETPIYEEIAQIIANRIHTEIQI